MEPLRVTCSLVAGAVLPIEGYLNLDALLAAAVCMIEDRTASTPADLVDVEIPVQRSACGRYHLAAALMWSIEARELRYVQRRFPLAEAIAYGDAKLRRVQQSSGSQKAFRIPAERQHTSPLEAWCVGERQPVVDLLSVVTRLGRRRGAGDGLVREWHVEPCEPWGDGFPVLRDGRPMRPLPLDTPGLGEHSPRIGRLTYPYWLRVGEEALACP